MSGPPPRGLHHVTCVCHAWEPTASFYEELGFRLVKNTVNHDAPDSRHIYLANEQGDPGTTITFFEWPSLRKGQPGLTSAQHVGLDLPAGTTLDDAANAIEAHGAETERVQDQGVECLQTRDPDGLALRLFEGDTDGPRLRHVGLYGAVDERRAYLSDVLGFTVTDEETGPPVARDREGRAVLELLPGEPGEGRIAPGAVHHVAFEVTDEEQAAVQAAIRETGRDATDVVDRIYFKSVYTRDPAGHTLEFATPGPGFTEDEQADALGERLVLPPWLEDDRDQIEAALDRKAKQARQMA